MDLQKHIMHSHDRLDSPKPDLIHAVNLALLACRRIWSVLPVLSRNLLKKRTASLLKSNARQPNPWHLQKSTRSWRRCCWTGYKIIIIMNECLHGSFRSSKHIRHQQSAIISICVRYRPVPFWSAHADPYWSVLWICKASVPQLWPGEELCFPGGSLGSCGCTTDECLGSLEP